MISIDYVNECLIYDPRSGSLTWKVRPVHHFSSARYIKAYNSQFAGAEAGTPRIRAGNPKPYKSLSISFMSVRKSLECHRVAFAIYHGYWPDSVDHFDGDTLNNEISNLRPANKSVNGRNKSLAKHNTSGVPGVSRNGRGWVVHGAGKPKLYIGRFMSFFEAVCARKSYEFANNYTARHGEVKS